MSAKAHAVPTARLGSVTTLDLTEWLADDNSFLHIIATVPVPRISVVIV